MNISLNVVAHRSHARPTTSALQTSRFIRTKQGRQRILRAKRHTKSRLLQAARHLPLIGTRTVTRSNGRVRGCVRERSHSNAWSAASTRLKKHRKPLERGADDPWSHVSSRTPQPHNAALHQSLGVVVWSTHNNTPVRAPFDSESVNRASTARLAARLESER